MNQKQIISDLGIEPNWYTKNYIAKLVSLFAFINVAEKLEGFKVTLNGVKGNIQIANELPEPYETNYLTTAAFNKAKTSYHFCKCLYGEFENWQQVTLTHKTGSYSFPFPINNRLYNVIAAMAGETILEPKNEVKEVILNTITIEGEVLHALSKAVKFIDKDKTSLRPVMQHVCVNIENYKVEVVATDAHKLFKSKSFESSEKKQIQLLLNETDCKVIAKMDLPELTEIHILNDSRIMIEGKIFSLFTERNYPDYPAVIPNYKKAMVFETANFISNVKKVLPSANKSTNQVTFHLNGNIQMRCADVDFSFESTTQINYISKNIPDTDIAFNGKFLLESLSIFKDKTIKMKTNGISTQAGIFTNDIDTVLIMPLMINN